MKNLYLILAVIGGVVPYFFFLRWFGDNGVDLGNFISALFANDAAAGFTADILIASVVFWIWAYGVAQARNIKNWWVVIILNLLVGLSCALPFFLYLRQRNIEET